MRNVMHNPVLVLNASYEPLHICAARRALVLIVKDAAHIQEHAGREVHAGIMFPTVIRLRRIAGCHTGSGCSHARTSWSVTATSVSIAERHFLQWS
jgi:hypothetical protein